MSWTEKPSNENRSHQVAAKNRLRSTIGLLISDIVNPIYEIQWLGGADVALEAGANFICFPGGALNSTQGFEAQANVIYDLVDADYFDGLHLKMSTLGMFTPVEKADELAAFVEQFRDIPLVGTESTSLQRIPQQVYIQVKDAIRHLMDHLIEVHGYRRIAFICGPEGHGGARARFEAYSEALARYGLPFEPDLIIPSSGGWVNRKAMQDFLDRRDLPQGIDFEAVVAAADGQALVMMEEIQARGVRIPEDVAVTGCDNLSEGYAASPPLTTVRMPFYEMGSKAIELLFLQLQEQDIPENIVLSPQVIVRRSCGCLWTAVEQAAAGDRLAGTSAVKKPVEAVLPGVEEEMIREMARTIGISAIDIVSGWIDRLSAALIQELVGAAHRPEESSGLFVSELEQILYQVSRMDADLALWQNGISVLRRNWLPHLQPTTAYTQFEDIWGQARVLIHQMERQSLIKERLALEQRATILRQINERLTTTFDVDALRDVLAQDLPRLDIPSFYLALYEKPQLPASRSRLIMAYNEDGGIELDAEGLPFSSCQIVPETMLPQDRPYSLVVQALHFRNEQLGFAVFEMGPRDGTLYDALAKQISSSLKGAMLMKQVQQHAQSLETEVAVRTADLAALNQALSQEVVERKRAEEQAKQTQSILAGAIENMTDGFALFDAEDRLLLCNEQYRSIYPKIRELIVPGVPFRDLVAAASERGQVVEVTDGGDESYLITRMHAWGHGEVLEYKTSEDRWIQARDSLLLGGGRIGIRLDITQRKQAEAALRAYSGQLEEMVEERTKALRVAQDQLIRQEKLAVLGQLAGGVGHELRNPIGVIANAVYYLQMTLAGADRAIKDYLDIISAHVHEAEEIISGLLSLSRTRPTEQLATNIANLVAGVLERYPPPENVNVITTLSSDLPALYVDAQQILQVMANLVTNAYQAMPNGGTLTISAEFNDPHVHLYVADTGIGLAPGMESQVFEPLFTTKAKGFGLGLTVSRSLVEVNGGQIRVESATGQGSTFILTLPATASFDATNA